MKTSVRRGAVALAMLAMFGCSRKPETPASNPPPAQPALKAPPPTPIEEKKEELGGNTWNPQWDVAIEKDLPPEMLSADAARAVRSYCPRFGEESEADKRAFWAYLFQALAGAEAGLNPTVDVRHTQAAVAKKDDVTKKTIRQEGLLQLTYEDAKRYDCDFDYARDKSLPEKDPARTILQPEKNLACGIKIMDNQIIRQHKPLIAHTSYWSTLHPGTVSYRVFAKQMVNVPAACGLRQARHSVATKRK